MAATNPYLRHLMTAALALPGIASGQTGLEAGDYELDYKHVAYEEDDDLMQVDAEYITFGVPVNDQNDLLFNLEYETLSGASAIFMTPDVDGTPIQVTSGASITEERTAFSARYRHTLDNGGRFSITPSASDENDYSSTAVTFEYQWDINNKNTSFSVGGGLASDTIESAVDATVGGDKDGTSLFAGVTQLLDAKSLFQVNFSLAEESGYLTDPYKLTLIGSTIAPETRPDDRQQMVLLGRYIRHVGENASLHLSYRYFQDDWEIRTHTLEASWHLELPNDWLLTPSLRYYSQEKAEFYAPYYLQARTDGFHSSDYRLASYGSILAGLRVQKGLGDRVKLNLDVQSYQRDGELKLSGDYSYDPLPLSSIVLTFGLTYTF